MRLEDHPDLDRSVSHAQERLAFRNHLAWFVWCSLIFLVLNDLLTPGSGWALAVVTLWGIAVLLHFVAVYLLGRPEDLRTEARVRAGNRVERPGVHP